MGLQWFDNTGANDIQLKRRRGKPTSTAFTVEEIPLITGTDGVIRVAGSRVTLDVLLEAFYEGATAEEIVQQYPTLKLADVYQILGYCLRHPQRFESYLEERKQHGLAIRADNETRFDPHGLRDRLIARRQSKR